MEKTVNSLQDIGRIYTPQESGYKKVKRGEIYYIEKAGYTGSEQCGGRPALIAGNDTGNEVSPVALIVYLTTQKKPGMPTHAEVMCREPSTALCEQVFTVDKSRIGDYIRTATEAEMQAVDQALAVSLGITAPDAQLLESTPRDDGLVSRAVERANEITGLVQHVRYVDGTLDKVQSSQLTGLLGGEAIKIDTVVSPDAMQLIKATAIEQIGLEKAVLLAELGRLLGDGPDEEKEEAQAQPPKDPPKKQRGGRGKIGYDKEKLKNLVGQGYSRQKIADEMGVSYNTITRWLEECGLLGKQCATCRYRETSKGRGNCNYLGVTGHSRGCSAERCTVYEQGDPETQRKALTL